MAKYYARRLGGAPTKKQYTNSAELFVQKDW